MGIVALILVPFLVIQDFLLAHTQHRVVADGQLFTSQSSSGLTPLLTLVNLALITPLITGAVVRAVAGAYMGERPTIPASIRFALPRMGWILLGWFLARLIATFALIGFVVPGIILYVRYSFTSEAVVVEGARGNALGRSWRLSKGRSWHIFGTLLFAYVLVGLVTAIFEVPLLLLQFNDPFGPNAWIARAVLGSITSVIATPFISIVSVLLYFDARIRKEAFDLAVMAAEVGSPRT